MIKLTTLDKFKLKHTTFLSEGDAKFIVSHLGNYSIEDVKIMYNLINQARNKAQNNIYKIEKKGGLANIEEAYNYYTTRINLFHKYSAIGVTIMAISAVANNIYGPHICAFAGFFAGLLTMAYGCSKTDYIVYKDKSCYPILKHEAKYAEDVLNKTNKVLEKVEEHLNCGRDLANI